MESGCDIVFLQKCTPNFIASVLDFIMMRDFWQVVSLFMSQLFLPSFSSANALCILIRGERGEDATPCIFAIQECRTAS